MIQRGGSNSTNFQADRIEVHGLTYEDARTLFMDLFENNFLKLKESAAQLAFSRAKELLDDYLQIIKTNFPSCIQELADPAMQAAIFTAQKEYAKSGDKNVEQLLVDLLVNRINQPVRSLLQLSLDEALEKASRLSVSQLNILALNYFLYKYIPDITDLASFNKYINTNLIPFIDDAALQTQEYLYLEYLGCGYKRTHLVDTLTVYFVNKYPGLFNLGFSEEEFDKKMEGLITNKEDYIIPCFNDVNKFQIKYLNLQSLVESFETPMGNGKFSHVNGELFNKLKEFILNTMPIDSARKLLLEMNEDLNKIGIIIHESNFGYFELTPIGRIIAISYYNNLAKEKIDVGNALIDYELEDNLIMKFTKDKEAKM